MKTKSSRKDAVKMKKRNGRRKEKYLVGSDIILNLKEISIGSTESFGSSSCSGNAGFYIDCSTEHGYCEDPRFSGVIRILSIKKSRLRNTYVMRIRFDKEREDE